MKPFTVINETTKIVFSIMFLLKDKILKPIIDFITIIAVFWVYLYTVYVV